MYAFLNRVKEYNSTLENPKYSPNALEELERYIPNFEVHDIERLIITQKNSHRWLQADILRIQNFLYHYFKDITLNEQTIPQTKVISFFFILENILDSIINYYGQNKINLLLQHFTIILQLMNVYHSS